MSLARYKTKRNFSRTTEPAGRGGVRDSSSGLRYVVQKHAARSLHYDFRLEMNGVLKSWAVPKGIPMQKAEKRLAVQVEDHPVAYRDFEGVIPVGNYGAGSVMVWDEGTYETVSGDPMAALKQGKLELFLRGRKLKGHWTLVRMKGKADDRSDPWLLIKTGEEARPISRRSEDRSMRSGRTMKQIAAEADATWQSNRAARVAR